MKESKVDQLIKFRKGTCRNLSEECTAIPMSSVAAGAFEDLSPKYRCISLQTVGTVRIKATLKALFLYRFVSNKTLMVAGALLAAGGV